MLYVCELCVRCMCVVCVTSAVYYHPRGSKLKLINEVLRRYTRHK